MGKNNELNVAFCVNNAYTNHLIVTVYSLLKNNSRAKIRIHVLSSDITRDSQEAIRSVVSSNKRASVVFHVIDKSLFSDMTITMDYITVETYYRLIMPEILKDVRKVLYLDADILVVGDISSIFTVLKKDSLAAGVPDIYLDSDNEYKEVIGLGREEAYINAGVMLYNLELMREENTSHALLESAKKLEHKYQDQDALNDVMKGRVVALDRQFNYQVKDVQYAQIPDEPQLILHYSGSKKPWNRDRPYDAFSTLYDQYKLEASRLVYSTVKNIKYGLLKYSTDNVGDNVQGIAARRFLPQVDYYFERDNMDATKTQPGEAVKVIINGWWGDGPENWPPLDQNLDVLPISMYVEDRIQDEFKKPRSIQLLNFNGPVGARSRGTEKFLKNNGVDAYFSGCLTLTLIPDSRVKKQDYILAVDVSDEVYQKMREQTDRRIIRFDVMRHVTEDVQEQYRMAEYYLYLYQSAHCVVTTRLHAMLPSIALGTPVLFINDILDDDDVRFSGLSNLAYNLSSKDYIKNPKKYNIDRPPKNSKEYMTIKRELEKRCEAFTGFDDKSSYLSSDVAGLLSDINLQQALLSGLDEMGKLRHIVGRLNNELSHKVHHVEELAAEVERLNSVLDTIHQSTSWRVTKPLRAVGRRIRR